MKRDFKDKRYRKYIESLIERCIKRDRAAWDEFAKAVSPLISFIIVDKFRKGGFPYQPDDIDNIKQDILCSIWEKDKLGTVTDRTKVLSWLCALAVHKTYSHIRKIKPVDRPCAEPLKDSLESDLPSPREDLSNKQIRLEIDNALESLKHKERLIIKLSLLYNEKYSDIARLLNMPLGTVLVYSRRAKIKLRKKLKKYVIK
jgi:RNA polymerase sigma-70 factor (ECF subfamily)